jgi:hypothetical protein
MLKDTRESLWQRFENGDPPDSLKTAFIKTNILLEKEAVDSTWFCRPPLPRLLGGVCVAGILSREVGEGFIVGGQGWRGGGLVDRWHGLEKIQMCFLTETYRSRSLFPPASIVQSCGNFIMQWGHERSPRKENSQVCH